MPAPVRQGLSRPETSVYPTERIFVLETMAVGRMKPASLMGKCFLRSATSRSLQLYTVAEARRSSLLLCRIIVCSNLNVQITIFLNADERKEGNVYARQDTFCKKINVL